MQIPNELRVYLAETADSKGVEGRDSMVRSWSRGKDRVRARLWATGRSGIATEMDAQEKMRAQFSMKKV